MRYFLRSVAMLCCLALLPNCFITVSEADSPQAEPNHKVRKRRRQMRRPKPKARAPRATKPKSKVKAKTKPAVRARPAPPLVAQPPKNSPPRSSARPDIMAPGVGAGRPDGFRSGAPAAYWIWQGPRGRWRVRTTTAKLLRHFSGHVQSMTSVLTGFDPSRLELRDQLWLDQPGWAFSFKTKGHADGFTFADKSNGCVKFDLVLGRPRNKPAQIFVGRNQVKPSGGHFILCPQGRLPTRQPQPAIRRKNKGKAPASRPGVRPPADPSKRAAPRRGR